MSQETLLINKDDLIGKSMTTQRVVVEVSQIVDVVIEQRKEIDSPRNDWWGGLVDVPVLVFANGARMVHPDFKNPDIV